MEICPSKQNRYDQRDTSPSLATKKTEASLVVGGVMLIIATLLFASVQSLGGGAYTLFMQLLGIMGIEKKKKDKETAIVHF